MTERTIHFPWREHLLQTKYPFADNATLTTAGGAVLDPDTFEDAVLYPIGATGQLFLSEVEITQKSVTLIVGTEEEGEVCRGSFSATAPPSAIKLQDSYGRPAGMLISTTIKLARFQAWGSGTHSLGVAAAPFAASVCIPTPEPGVRGFVLDSGEVFAADTWIVGERGVVVRQDPDEPNKSQIRVDIVGDPLFRRALCEDSVNTGGGRLFITPQFLKTINGIGPNQYGEFTIMAAQHEELQNILRVHVEDGSLIFEMVGQEM